ncbi:hypothetical protein Q667_01680 [Marinobacter sp. C1S70]|uniref:hypothetical protein n=1 Tax=Marinobacter TaxID=2742 RepID=UPI0003B7EA1B|nr:MULTISPECIES: hypothetical protein [Marinobacter]ERS89469.1 hypothetical protein Q667_01680 [Marinobacter sp. C1S70]TPW23546.1 hypothetical protein FH712_10670 [Marinobacter nauticus]
MVKLLRTRIERLENASAPKSEQRAIMAELRRKLAEPDLSDHKRALIEAIIHQQGIIQFHQRHAANDIGIGADFSELYPEDTTNEN